MLRKHLRLSSSRDFDRVYRQGRQFSTPHLRLFRALNARENQNKTRFGFVVSKKQAQKIVKRNRIKRILRSLTYANLPRLPKGYDYVIQGKIGIERILEKQLRAEFSELIAKQGKL